MANDAGRIPAIETYYNGFRFRSRLEARWAVFFDCMGVKYEYEPEKFQCGDVKYIPDFFLPELGRNKQSAAVEGTFFEVKGYVPSSEEIDKLNRLAATTHLRTYLFHGSAFDGTGGLFSWGHYRHELTPTHISQCPFCGIVDFPFTPERDDDELSSLPHLCIEECLFAQTYNIDSNFLDFQSGAETIRRPSSTPMLDIAYQMAKSARFEDPSHAIEIKSVCALMRKLAASKIWCGPATLVAIHKFAASLAANPQCPRYYEPWYVTHIQHFQFGRGLACPCSMCESTGTPSGGAQ